jgi:hypothetical protein
VAHSTALARVARQSNHIHDRLARCAIEHLREGARRAAVVNVYHQRRKAHLSVESLEARNLLSNVSVNNPGRGLQLNGDSTTADQFFPTITVTPDGSHGFVTWYA